MIQLEKMVKNPPTDGSAYFDIAEEIGAFKELQILYGQGYT